MTSGQPFDPHVPDHGNCGNGDEEMLFDNADQALSVIATVIEVVSIELHRLRGRLPAVNILDKIERLRRWFYGDYRSLTRVLGSKLMPYQPASRFFPHMLQEKSSHLGNEELDNRVPVLTLFDVDWLMNSEGNQRPEPGIHHRCEYFGFPFCPEVPAEGCERGSFPKISTPVLGNASRDVPFLPSHCSAVMSAATLSQLDRTENTDHPGSERIAALEEELAKLKEQMALIIMAKEQSEKRAHAPKEPVVNDRLMVETRGRSRSNSFGSCDSGISGGEEQGNGAQGPTVAVVPPPPPPPPPAIGFLRSAPLPPKPEVKVAEMDKAAVAPRKSVPSMSDVLKELHTVKLKPLKLERSPGGTPLKRPLSQRNHDPLPSDPGAFIAEALRRKFAAAIGEDSPASDAESQFNTSWDVTPEKTPKVSKRRSSVARAVKRIDEAAKSMKLDECFDDR